MLGGGSRKPDYLCSSKFQVVVHIIYHLNQPRSNTFQLHQAQGHPTPSILEHCKELIAQLDEAGVRVAQGVIEDGEDADGGGWEDDDDAAMEE